MAELPTINLALYAQTDVGMVRSGNEDNFLILDLSSGKSWTANEEEPHELLTYAQGYYGTLLAVSDGMGGALAGEVASRMAVETVRDRMLQLQAHEIYGKMPFHERMRLAVEEANLVIHADGQTNQAHRGLGATFTAVGINGSSLYFAQVGDSRAYLIRQGDISRVTKDQSLVQQLIDAGQITEEEAETHSYRNVILQALGAHNNVNVEVNKVELCQLDTLVLCSDGLSGKMHADDIARIVIEAGDFKSACQSLISLANERGGEDNITVVIAQFSGSGLPLPNGSVEPEGLARSPDTPTEITWNTGAKTDPLDQAGNQAASKTDAAQRATEPLPVPPKQATPFTAPLQREIPERKRTNDLSDRVEPITAVFSVEDFESDLSHQGSSQSQTAPLGGRHTAPLTVEMPAPAPVAKAPVDVPPGNNGSQAKPKNSKTNLAIFIGLLILGITGLVFVATTYVSRQKAESEAKQLENARQDEELQKERQSSIDQVRNKITKLRNQLGASTKPSLESKLEGWRSKLSDFDRQLDELGSKSPEEAKNVCTEIEREIQKIDEEFNNAQGLIPSRNLNRAPVKL
ncbi:MAG: protein phosphatase 2C domain-containing protein [Acidobacteriota bacterium]|nr:protein phosphatase 2C domain-containing protein [Acidobacteriota bacterium]